MGTHTHTHTEGEKSEPTYTRVEPALIQIAAAPRQSTKIGRQCSGGGAASAGKQY